MDEKPVLLITERRRSAGRRFWRELYALVRWGTQKAIYKTEPPRQVPFGIVGHEGFSVSMRKLSSEIEVTFFEPVMTGRTTQEARQMERDMIEALAQVGEKYGFEAYRRERKPTLFA